MRKILVELKSCLTPEGAIFVKEQFHCNPEVNCKTEYLENTKDWMRSFSCFAAAFKGTGYDAEVVSKYQFDCEYYPWVSFVLRPSTSKTTFGGMIECATCRTLVHTNECKGITEA